MVSSRFQPGRDGSPTSRWYRSRSQESSSRGTPPPPKAPPSLTVFAQPEFMQTKALSGIRPCLLSKAIRSSSSTVALGLSVALSEMQMTTICATRSSGPMALTASMATPDSELPSARRGNLAIAMGAGYQRSEVISCATRWRCRARSTGLCVSDTVRLFTIFSTHASSAPPRGLLPGATHLTHGSLIHIKVILSPGCHE